MADVLLTLNGIGRGHLTRSLQIARWLRRRRRRPMIFLQGTYPEAMSLRVPGAGIQPLYELPLASAQLVVDRIASYAALNGPAVVIEDTHPAPVNWPSDVVRFLVVRPADFRYMKRLHERCEAGIARVIVCDHPDSPTWPYETVETDAILGWPKWAAIGPIFRQPTSSGMRRMIETYRGDDECPLFVFTLGGGGERPGSNDCVDFIQRSLPIAARLRELWPAARLLFVRGPLFPAHLDVPAVFESIPSEQELPSLLKIARGAVIRPGFNLTWECVAAGTPFVALPGTTYAEPVGQRLMQLRRNGIDHSASVDRWGDPQWLTDFREGCRAMTARFCGDPAQAFLDVFDDGLQERHAAAASSPPPPAGNRQSNGSPYDALRKHLREVRAAKRLLVRVDDVIDGDAVVSWIIAACRERSLPLSLEVIPYFLRFNGRRLDALDPGGLCEVSQHGWAHVPHGGGGPSGRGEFAGHRLDGGGAAATLLRRGRRLLSRTFGDRFRGGYSAPYDGWPEGIAALWSSLGGRYLSWIANRPTARRIADIQLGVDVWDWRAGGPKSPAAILTRCSESLRRRAPIGLVLHPQCLDHRSTRSELERLLDALVDGGCVGELVSRAALASDEPRLLEQR